MTEDKNETVEINEVRLYVTVPQKDIVNTYFKDDLALVTKFCNMITNDTDRDFRYYVFKDFIFSAAGMMRDIDQDLYNEKLLNPFKIIQSLDSSYTDFKAKSKHVMTVYVNEFLQWQDDYVAQKKRYEDLQSELQMLISAELILSEKFKVAKVRIKGLEDKGTAEEILEKAHDKLKTIRSEHVDTIHTLGERRKELQKLQELLSNFEEEHKALFNKYFKAMKEKLEIQYQKALDFFGYRFNKRLFIEAGRSEQVQKFKQKAYIVGDLDLCKYVHYYLKNVSTDDLVDQSKKESLIAAKQYCKNQREKANLY